MAEGLRKCRGCGGRYVRQGRRNACSERCLEIIRENGSERGFYMPPEQEIYRRAAIVQHNTKVRGEGTGQYITMDW